MGERNQKKSKANHKKEDGKFRSKHISHDPQAESSRAVFHGESLSAVERKDVR